jgi:putative transposase
MDPRPKYPVYGFFKRLHADFASAHRSEAFRSACYIYGINPDVRVRGPSFLGGHIERLLSTMLGKMLQLPGATGGDVTQRDGYDPAEQAELTLQEFEHWLIREICRYHLKPHGGLGKVTPLQKWQDGVEMHGALVPPGIDLEQLNRRFLPWISRTVSAKGIKFGYRHYWHPDLTPRIGDSVTVHYDERTIQAVYPELDGKLVTAGVTGTFPDVTLAEWNAAATTSRKRGRGYQQAEVARLVEANQQEVLNARIRTREQRRMRKRAEREGASHSSPPTSHQEPAKSAWLPVTELEEVEWLKPRLS